MIEALDHEHPHDKSESSVSASRSMGEKYESVSHTCERVELHETTSTLHHAEDHVHDVVPSVSSPSTRSTLSATERFEIEHDQIEPCKNDIGIESTHDYFEDAIFEEAWEEIVKDEKHDEMENLMRTLDDDQVELKQQDLDLSATLRQPLYRHNKNDDDIFEAFQDDDDVTYDFEDMDPFAENTLDTNNSTQTFHAHHDFTQEMMTYIDQVVFVSKVLFAVQKWTRRADTSRRRNLWI